MKKYIKAAIKKFSMEKKLNARDRIHFEIIL